jgi:pyruvate formate lyase activating enzyme
MKRNYLGWITVLAGISFSLLIIKKGIDQSQKPISPSDLKEASYYRQLENGMVQCELCPNRCLLAEGQRGLCKVRQNIAGKLYSLVYGKPVSIHVDPIEKKPLYHFLPGAKAYSLATAGCNLECKYCQNWDIAQRFPEDLESVPMSPEEVVNQALQSGAQVIAFTYNEPVVWYEYMLDIAKLAQEKGLKTVMVSSGYINQEPLENLLPYLDAIKIDLKSFNDEVYAQLIRGKLEPILQAITTAYQSGTWLELVHLVVPGYTDDLEEIKQMCIWIKENVGTEVPVHFSKFTPKYKLMDLSPTPEESVEKARQVCLDVGLKYVYTGNIPDEAGSTTYCPDNNEPVIKRFGFFVQENFLNSEGKASGCLTPIPGVWE